MTDRMRVALVLITSAILGQAMAQEPVASPEATASEVVSEETAPTTSSPEMTSGGGSPEVLAEPASPEPEDLGPSHDPEAVAILEQMASSHADLETIEGAFRQHKYSETFLEEIESTGEFWCRRPDLMRFDYEASESAGASTYWVLPDSLWVYIPELDQAEIYPNEGQGSVANTLSQVLIGLDGAVDEIRDEHWVSLVPPSPEDAALGEAIAHLLLEPKEGVDDQGFISTDLWVDTVTLLPVQLKLIEESGDETTLTLTTVTLNPELSAAVFDPQANIPDTAVIEEMQ